MTTRKQHYVWRYYLEAWQRADGLVNCLRDGRMFATNPANIMAERDFYRLSELTKPDVMFFESWLARNNQNMRGVHRSLFIELGRIANGNALIQSKKNVSAADKSLVQALAIETEEKLHAGIEASAIPLIDELRKKQTGFLDDDESAMSFFQFIAHQYFRTKNIREAIGNVLSLEVPGQDFSRLTNILCYCVADNLGGSLYVDRKIMDVVVLENSTERGFITGDQPVVNLMATENESPPEDLVLYYPISPRLTVLIAPKNFNLRSVKVGSEAVEQLNEFIAWKSKHFLVGYSSHDLRTFPTNANFRARPACPLILQEH